MAKEREAMAGRHGAAAGRRTIKVSELKARCRQLKDEVAETGDTRPPRTATPAP